MISILGQQLECRRISSENSPGDYTYQYRLLEGMGLCWPKYSPQIECWIGAGPHSSGGLLPPTKVTERDCLACGADWFVPFLARLKSGELVPIEEIETCHVSSFSRPILRMDDLDNLFADFYRHLSSGGSPESFFPCCRIVRTEWDEANKMWQIVK